MIPVVTALMLVVTSVSVGIAKQNLDPPLSRLLYTGQLAPNGAYQVTGFPGCALPGTQLECRVVGGLWRDVGRVNGDGSFFFEIPFPDAKEGLAIKVEDGQERHSSVVELRTDHPLMGGMWLPPNKRGWVNIITASTDERDHERRWLEVYDPEHIARRMDRVNRWLQQQHAFTLEDLKAGRATLPESLRAPANPILMKGAIPEHLKIYGYTPSGGTATCIIGGSQLAFSVPISADGHFSITVPYQAVVLEDNRLPSFLINITDLQNHLLAAHAFGEMACLPEWALRRRREVYETNLKRLVGQQIPQVQFMSVKGESPLILGSEAADSTVVIFWATWCGPCLQELRALQVLLEEPTRPGVHVATVSIDTSESEVREFLTKKGLDLPVYIDREGSQLRNTLWDRIGIETAGVPFTMMIESGGTISFAKWRVMSKDELASLIR